MANTTTFDMTPQFTYAAWRKSSRTGSGSGGGGDCIEVALGVGAIAIRDTKNRSGAILVHGQAEWKAFLNAVKNDDLLLS